jgi:hypothetical protein
VVTAGPSDAGLWQTRTGTLLFLVAGNSGALTAAAYSAGSGRFVTGSVNGAVAAYACDVCGPPPRAACDRRGAAPGAPRTLLS